jgi:Abortive infection bacteriophage resistance protein
MEVKTPTTIDEQIQKIESRGCVVNDEEYAREILYKVNYYRLTAYFLPFKKANGDYIKNLTFERVYNIYEFDKKLRGIIFPIIEGIEVALRFQISYYHAHKYGALGYESESNFNKTHMHYKFEERINRMIYINKNQKFVKHHLTKYNGKFPIWVIIELFSMSELSIFYSDLIDNDKRYIANTYFNTTHECLSSWLYCLTLIRNNCAHYSPLYYNIFHATPKNEKNQPYDLSNKLFDYIYVLKLLYRNIGNWNTELFIPLQALIEKYADDINLKHINFSDNWSELLK